MTSCRVIRLCVLLSGAVWLIVAITHLRSCYCLPDSGSKTFAKENGGCSCGVGDLMFRALPPGRALGRNLSFPIDSSSRALHRSKSERDFPLESLGRASVRLKFTPLELKWRSAGAEKEGREGKSSDDVGRKSSPARVDPHRTGFGRIPTTTKVRSPPPCPSRAGVLGVDPGFSTRGAIAGG